MSDVLQPLPKAAPIKILSTGRGENRNLAAQLVGQMIQGGGETADLRSAWTELHTRSEGLGELGGEPGGAVGVDPAWY
ncbi:hypothetical protein Q8W71_27930 [Methylobacterium sp. NEAU 140]|uniref:hypothetical protein n=1 Tax=Methylobacterium sp. NEAU 140 TaxID=3064945 RepID=UPI002736D202|nr:hypothetical protein [Methylobacterium sp. NEAU 140]MDP4026454.1 hypothetical protein [Methylobacterium sp. NEAU 140]